MSRTAAAEIVSALEAELAAMLSPSRLLRPVPATAQAEVDTLCTQVVAMARRAGEWRP